MRLLISFLLPFIVSANVFSQDLFEGDFIKKMWLEYKFYPRIGKSYEYTPDGKQLMELFTSKTEQSLVFHDVFTAKTDTVKLPKSKWNDKGVWSKVQFVDKDLYLLQSSPEAVFRHSIKANYAYLYHGELKSVDEEKISVVSFSPNKDKMAFVKDGDLYCKSMSSDLTVAVTASGESGKILNAHADWVHEEEFGFTQAYEWSGDGSELSYLEYDVSEVGSYPIERYLNDSIYPVVVELPYPKAGEANAKVKMYRYDLATNKRTLLKDASINDEYVPWFKYISGNRLLYLTLDRLQQKLSINMLDSSGEKQVYSENDPRYVEFPSFLKVQGENLLVTSEKSGYQHLYAIDLNSGKETQLTSGDWSIREVVYSDLEQQNFVFTSTQFGSINNVLVQQKNGGLQSLSPESGWATVEYSPDGKTYMLKFSTSEKPPVRSLVDAATKRQLRSLGSDKKLEDLVGASSLVKKDFFEVVTPEGVKLSAWIMKPSKIKKKQKYPALIYTYGGPGSQTVKNQWDTFNYWWYNYLVSKGYVVLSVDGRGTGAKGVAFKKQTYGKLGELESEDQKVAIEYLRTLPCVDQERIGIWGWSFGGYLSLLTASKAADKLKLAIAVAPVTHWGFYDTIYTERYLGKPQDNKEGYDLNSPLLLAEEIKTKVLLVHGSADDNVHIQNSYRMQQALIKANKQFEVFYYPDKNHAIVGGNTRYHLFTLLTNYILTEL